MKLARDQLYISIFLGIFNLADENVAAALLFAMFFLQLATNRASFATFLYSGVNAFLILMLLCGFSTFLLSPFPINPYFIGRDIYYFVAAVMLVLIGFSFGSLTKDRQRLIWAMIVVLTAISIFQYSEFFLSGAFLNVSLQARYFYGLDSSLPLLILMLLMVANVSGISLGSHVQRTTILWSTLYFLIASLSRINIGILLFAVVFLRARGKFFRYFGLGAIFLLIAAPVVLGIVSGSNNNPVESTTFLEKILGSLDEISIRDQVEFSSINLNWRGYEAYQGVAAVLDNGSASVWAGLGYGSFVEGPFEDKLNYIPVFHNGYVTVFFKGGIIGIYLFLAFFKTQAFGVLKFSRPNLTSEEKADLVFLDRLAFTMVIALAFDTLAAHGVLYTKPPLMLFVLGIVQGARYKLHRKITARLMSVPHAGTAARLFP